MAKAVKTVGVPASGGDAPGINAAIRAVVRTAINRGLEVRDIMRGHAGLLEEEIVDVESTSMSNIINHDDIILYTVRCKEFTTAEGQQKDVDIYRKHGIDGMMVIGGDGFFRDAGKLSTLGINTIGLPGTIDLDITCTDYTIGFDTAVNAAIETVDKIRDTSTSYKRYSIVGVTGRSAGYIALQCGIGNGAEDVLLPERYDGNEQVLVNRITDNHRWGKKRNITINAEGVGHSGPMTKHIKAATGIETRATTLGHVQRGGTPICKDRVYTSIMGAKAVELPTVGRSNHLVAYKHGEFVDFDTREALNMTKSIPEEQCEIAKMLTR